MPVIPVYRQNVSLPSGSANEMGNVAQAGMVGQAIEKAGDVITQTAIQLQEEQDKYDRINYSNQYTKLADEYKFNKMATLTSGQAIGMTKQADLDYEELTKNFLTENVPARLHKTLLPILQDINNHHVEHISTYELGQRNVYKKEVVENAINVANQSIAHSADSPIDVNLALARLNAQLESLNVSQADIDTHLAKSVLTAIEANIDNGRVQDAQSYAEKYKVLLESQGLSDNARRLIHTAQKEVQTTNAYATLYEKFGGNFFEMSSYLDDPAHQKELGLDIEQAFWVKRRIAESIRSQKASAVNVATDYAGQIQDKMITAWGQGKPLTTQEIVTMPEYKQLMKLAPYNQYAQLALQKINKEIERPDRSKIDSVMVDMMDAEKLTTSTVAEIKEEALKRGLGASDIQKLLTARQKYLSNPEEYNYAKFKTDTVRTLLRQAGIKNEDEITSLEKSAANYLYAEERRLGRNLTIDEAQQVIIKGLQNVIVNERTSLFGFNLWKSQTKKRLMQVKNKSAILSPYDEYVPDKKESNLKDLVSKNFPDDAQKALAVVKAESSWDPTAININNNGTIDYGLFQINSIWIPELKSKGIINNADDLFDVGANVSAAKYIYNKAGKTFDRDWAASKHKWGAVGNKPDLTAWLSEAKKMNPGASESQLIAFYNKKYK